MELDGRFTGERDVPERAGHVEGSGILDLGAFDRDDAALVGRHDQQVLVPTVSGTHPAVPTTPPPTSFGAVLRSSLIDLGGRACT